MIRSIGFVETNSIAKGVEAADAMLKAAQVELLFSRPNCPGKYNVLVCGEVAAVQAAVDAGARVAGGFLIEQLVIAQLHPSVVPAINLGTAPGEVNAVGILEYFSITGAILGADTAVKAAEVELIDVRLGTGIGGKSFAVLTGEVAAVQAAVDCGIAAAQEAGLLLASAVIPRPTPAVFESLL